MPKFYVLTGGDGCEHVRGVKEIVDAPTPKDAAMKALRRARNKALASRETEHPYGLSLGAAIAVSEHGFEMNYPDDMLVHTGRVLHDMGETIHGPDGEDHDPTDFFKSE